MGCSASRFDTLLAKAIEDPSFSLSYHNSFSSSSSSSTKTNAASSTSTSTSSSSFSAPFVHHPAIRKGDTHHLVSLTSSTYGSLIVVDNNNNKNNSSALVENGVVSDQCSPDSVINTWELMEGLEEDEQVGAVNNADNLSDSFVFVGMPQQKDDEKDLNSKSRPLWKHLSEESLLSKMDPNVGSSYERALSTRKSYYPGNDSKLNETVSNSIAAKTDSQLAGCGEDKIVLYFTSLRGIRRTYEDCCAVRLILRGFRVMMDERDVSMDSTYKKELQSALGGITLSLPHLFIRGKHIGGVNEIKQLHETGELGRLLDGFPVLDYRTVCEVCGDARFTPCSTCNGSRKVFRELEGKTDRCPDCNENGLIRCPGCCSTTLTSHEC